MPAVEFILKQKKAEKQGSASTAFTHKKSKLNLR